MKDRSADPPHTIRVGCAGWSIPKTNIGSFASQGSQLVRYACRFNAVEINSSFYRHHRHETYARWAKSVPVDFRFAVKVPKTITHERRLVKCESELDQFLTEATQLGGKLGPLLIQLPPSLPFAADVAEEFFAAVRQRFDGGVALEPRHASWFDGRGDNLVAKFHITRVAADPSVVPIASEPGGWEGLVYYRLHGSPKMYYSAYSEDDIEALAKKISSVAPSSDAWCIFDNTALGTATTNAIDLLGRIPHAD
jgi:uncharacterized protein YecE (DUF72 family)